MVRLIYIRPAGATEGGTQLAYTATEIAAIYTPFEQAQLALGLSVTRDGETHTDLLAFHDRHTNRTALPPRRRGLAGLLGKLAA